MDVRQVRPKDAPLVLALALDESSHLVRCSDWPVENPVVRTVAQTLVPLAVPGRAWLARDESSVGLLEARPRQYVIGWDITRLAVRGDPNRVLRPLLWAATQHVQSRGVPRLFARCAEEYKSTLESLGFLALAREYLLTGNTSEAAEDASLPVDSRYRMPQDAWPLHQLEREITPPMIGQIEGLTSLDWSHRSRHSLEIVVEREGRIVAWIACRTKPQGRFVPVGMLVHPDYKDLGPVLLRHVLHRASPGYPLVTRVRDYQVDTLNAFLDAGFAITAEEVLMVKHAQVEFALDAKLARRVATIPTIQAFRSHLAPIGPDITRRSAGDMDDPL